MTVALATFYVAGAVLELGGLALVAWDVYDSQRQLEDMSRPEWTREQPPRSGTLFTLMARVSAGNVKRRALGVVAFALGVVVQTIGNLAAL